MPMTADLVERGALGRGIAVYRDPDGGLWLKINDEGGVASASGKMTLTASSGGWKDVPGGDGLRLNLTAGRYYR